jgi:hypothetical protein
MKGERDGEGRCRGGRLMNEGSTLRRGGGKERDEGWREVER